VKIARIAASLHRVPIETPLLTAKRLVPVLVVRVEADDGQVGYGVAGAQSPEAVLAVIDRDLGPFLVGRDPLRVEACYDAAQQRFNPRAATGIFSSALSGIDIALWDLKGRVAGLPVWQLLGGFNSQVPAYVTFGLPEYDLEQLAEAARLVESMGFSKLKMVVGRGLPIAQDLERVRRVRESVGSGVELMVDANCSLDLQHATELAEQLEARDVAFFEEPLHGNDISQMVELRRRTRLRLAVGQFEGHKWRLRDLVTAGAVDLLQTNVLYVGGYTEALKVAHLAETFRLPIGNGGGWADHNAPLFAAVPNGWGIEVHAWQWQLAETLYANPPVARGGVLTLTERPGVGLEPREDVLRNTRIPL
jgi:L-alanine-DL-glutamate epimerase-like enolase superfamily enzyme